jgi:NAD(P)H dehydrogenase (quinone)
MASSPIAVSGAGGRLGRGIVEHLLARGAGVIASTRTPGGLAGTAATVRVADFDDPPGLEGAWRGAGTLVLVPTDAPGERRLAQHAAALRAAAAAGVGHVVYLGVVEHGPEPTLADDHLATEQLVRSSGMAWTVLRNGIYADLLVGRALAEGAVVFGGGEGSVAWVARDDLAEAAAVVALAAADHAGAILTLTGAQALSLHEVGAGVATATGREIPVTALDADAFAAGLRAAGMPDGVVAAMRGTAQAMQDGRLATVTGDLERLLGRPPRSVGALAGELAGVQT